jgi:hypothetical protein
MGALDKDKRVEWAVEASACPIEHLGLIKFWAVNF